MKLEKNASVCMKALPFWMLPYTFYMYYLSLFLMEKGLTSSQITLLMSITNITSLVFSFVASPIVDRLGRKNTLTIFDLLSSAVPAAILLVSQSFVPAMIALGLSGLNRVMSTAYYLVLVEDTSDRNSMDSMNMFNIITVLSGVATPIAGIIVTKLGIIRGENLFLIVSVVLMTTQCLVRHFFISETPTGMAVKAAHSKFSLKDVLVSYRDMAKHLGKNRRLLAALLINSLMYVYYNLGTTTSLLFTPYFAHFRNLTGVVLASIGSIYSIGTLFSMLVINPRMDRKTIHAFILISGLVSMCGFAMIILCPAGNTVLLIAAVILLALGYGVLKSGADALLAMENEGEFGAGVYALAFVLSSVFSILAIQLVNILYEKSPNWLFGLSAAIVAIIIGIAIPYVRPGKEVPDA
ncbi:MAG: MFS transporter [Spirochaetales bacterium]|nr:MFS transporter [Spirochaetales bacterium]